MALTFEKIQSFGDGEEPDLLHFGNNDVHVLYTKDGSLYVQTTDAEGGIWDSKVLSDETNLSSEYALDTSIENLTIDRLGGFGGVGTYKTDDQHILLMYGIERPDDVLYDSIITSIEHDYDNNQLSMTISDKPYLNDDLNYLTALWAKSNKTANYVDSQSYDWNTAKTQSDEAKTFIESPIDVNNNTIEIGDAIQKAQITRRGILAREDVNTNGQMRIFTDKILFTNDNWASYSVAIDSNGITTNGDFILRTDNDYGGNNLVTIDGDGIKIYGDGSVGNGIEVYNITNNRTFYLDTAGNANFTGVITGGVFQTDVPFADGGGARIVIEDDTFKVYDAAGKKNGLWMGDGVGDTYGEMAIFHEDAEIFTINMGVGGTSFRTKPGYDLAIETGAGGTVRFDGDFSFEGGSTVAFGATTVTGLNTDTESSHDHGIPNGTKLLVDGGGTVTWSSDGNHSHSVE